MPRTSHSSRFYNRTILGEQYISLSSSICSFLHSPVTAAPLAQIFSLTTYFKHPQPTFLPQRCRAYLSKTAAFLQIPMLEAHGKEWQNVRRLHCAGIDHVVRMARGRYKVRFSTAFWGQKAPAYNTVFNCVRSVKCGQDCTVRVIATPLNL
jgi:hypothetical protein